MGDCMHLASHSSSAPQLGLSRSCILLIEMHCCAASCLFSCLVYSTIIINAAMLQQPRVPPTGQRQAIEVHIKWREVLDYKRELLRCLSIATGWGVDKLDADMQRPLYMRPQVRVCLMFWGVLCCLQCHIVLQQCASVMQTLCMQAQVCWHKFLMNQVTYIYKRELLRCLSIATGWGVDKLDADMQRPLYMRPQVRHQQLILFSERCPCCGWGSVCMDPSLVGGLGDVVIPLWGMYRHCYWVGSGQAGRRHAAPTVHAGTGATPAVFGFMVECCDARVLLPAQMWHTCSAHNLQPSCAEARASVMWSAAFWGVWLCYVRQLRCLSIATGWSVDKLDADMQRPLYMRPQLCALFQPALLHHPAPTGCGASRCPLHIDCFREQAVQAALSITRSASVSSPTCITLLGRVLHCCSCMGSVSLCRLQDALEYDLIDEVIMPDAARLDIRAATGRCTDWYPPSPVRPPSPCFFPSCLPHRCTCLTLLCAQDALEYGLIDKVIMPDAAKAKKAATGRCTDCYPPPCHLFSQCLSHRSHTSAPVRLCFVHRMRWSTA
jgi:hypothetical protein